MHAEKLPESDILLFDGILSYVPHDLLPDILAFLKASPNSCHYLADNYRTKMKAIETNDEKLLDEVIKGQQDFLLSLVGRRNK